jgi:hypothetical protein
MGWDGSLRSWEFLLKGLWCRYRRILPILLTLFILFSESLELRTRIIILKNLPGILRNGFFRTLTWRSIKFFLYFQRSLKHIVDFFLFLSFNRWIIAALIDFTKNIRYFLVFDRIYFIFISINWLGN